MSLETGAPAWRQADAFLFDIDGTLLNSRDAVHYNAFCTALRQVFRLQASLDGVAVHGNTDPGILRAVTRNAGVPEAVFQAGLPRALEIMRAEALHHRDAMRPELCRGARELVEALAGRGKLLSVASGNLEAIGWAKLEAAGLRRFFPTGAFSDQAETRAEIFRLGMERLHALRPGAKVCVVGDTPADVEAARACGIPVVAVASGIFSPEHLAGHGPDAGFACCGDLLAELSE